jgi:recombination associated protein RdgC
MFPRNLNLFRFDVMPHADVEAALGKHRSREPGPQEFATQGFVSPYGRTDDRMTIRSGSYVGFRYQARHRDLRPTSVNEAIAKEIDAITKDEGRKVGTRERKRIRDDVVNRMLPHAPVISSNVFGWLDPINGWLVLDVRSRRNAEAVLSSLREAFGSFPAVPLAPDNEPRLLLTHWLATGEVPKHIALGAECELRDPTSHGAVVKCRNQDLDTDEVREHLRSGKQCFSAGLVYDDRVDLVLSADLTVTGLRPLDVILEAQGGEHDSEDAEIESDFALATLEVAGLLAFLEDAFKIRRPRSA